MVEAGARTIKCAEPQALEPSALVAKYTPGFRVSGSIVAGGNLHIIRRGERPGYLVENEVVTWLQSDVFRL